MYFPEGVTEFYVSNKFDAYIQDRFVQTGFLVFARKLVSKSPKTYYGIVDYEHLFKICNALTDLESKNVSIEDGELMILDTVNSFNANVDNDFKINNSLVEVEEIYEGSMWWLLSTLTESKAEVVLDNTTQPITNLKFSESTFTLYYPHKVDGQWKSTKLFWYTDIFHFLDKFKVRVLSEDMSNNPEAHKLLALTDRTDYIDVKGQRAMELTFNLSKFKIFTKDLSTISNTQCKELLIKDARLSRESHLKIMGANLAKYILEELMEVIPTDEFQVYTVNSGVKQVSNLSFSIYDGGIQRKVIRDYLSMEENQSQLFEYIDSGDVKALDPLQQFVTSKYGVTVYTKALLVGFINSIVVNDEGLFDYRLHNLNMQDYQKEAFLFNLQLHKERIQYFNVRYSFDYHTDGERYVDGGEYRDELKIKKVNYVD